tara:strand:- start:560 stop:1225 length:666 start_codon:yes stop_codon:yes gene_type:complete
MFPIILIIVLINNNFIVNKVYSKSIDIKKNIENFKSLNVIKKDVYINTIINNNNNNNINIHDNIIIKKKQYINDNINIKKNIQYIQDIDKFNNIDIYNELLFLLNLKTKVYVNISKIIPHTNIYHIGIIFITIKDSNIYEMTNDLGLHFLEILPNSNEYEEIFWGYTNKTLDDIHEYEKSLNNKYILGLYDCRHYTRDLSNWTTHKPTPVWKLKDIVNYNI